MRYFKQSRWGEVEWAFSNWKLRFRMQLGSVGRCLDHDGVAFRFSGSGCHFMDLVHGEGHPLKRLKNVGLHVLSPEGLHGRALEIYQRLAALFQRRIQRAPRDGWDMGDAMEELARKNAHTTRDILGQEKVHRNPLLMALAFFYYATSVRFISAAIYAVFMALAVAFWPTTRGFEQSYDKFPVVIIALPTALLALHKAWNPWVGLLSIALFLRSFYFPWAGVLLFAAVWSSLILVMIWRSGGEVQEDGVPLALTGAELENLQGLSHAMARLGAARTWALRPSIRGAASGEFTEESVYIGPIESMALDGRQAPWEIRRDDLHWVFMPEAVLILRPHTTLHIVPWNQVRVEGQACVLEEPLDGYFGSAFMLRFRASHGEGMDVLVAGEALGRSVFASMAQWFRTSDFVGDAPKGRPAPGSASQNSSREANPRGWALKVLGLDSGADWDDVRAAYYRCAKEHHPDRWMNSSEAEQEAHEKKMQEVNEAFAILEEQWEQVSV